VSGHRSFKELRAKVVADPKRRARVEEIGRAYDTLLALAALRESRGVTQERMAGTLGVSQPNVSKVERNADVRLSTLCGYVEALGGHVEINAVFPGQTVGLALPCGRRTSVERTVPAHTSG
jgi:DNA-binding XRE family transcriptional regulator